MPTVPLYGAPKVEENALPNVYRSGVPESAYGGQVAEGVQGLGQGLAQDAQAADQLQQMHDEAGVRQLDVRAGNVVRQSVYDPTDGFLAKQGADALNARPAVEKSIDDQFGDIMGQAQNQRQARMLAQVLATRREQAFSLIDSHAQAETKSYLVNSTRSSAETHVNSAISAFTAGDVKNSFVHLEAARDAQRQADALQGVGQDVHLVNDLALTSNFAKAIVVDRLDHGDANGAQGLYDQFGPEMTASDRLALEAPLREATIRQKAFDFANGQFDSGAASPPGPASPAASAVAARIKALVPDPQDAANITTIGLIESGLGANAHNGSSQGLFQFHPDTFVRYGGDLSKINDLDEQIRVMSRAYADEKALAQKALGGETPDAWQIYLVHQQGVAGGPALLGADPNANAIGQLQDFTNESPAMARAAIMNNLPQAVRSKFGAQGPTVGQFLASWQGLFSRRAGQGAQAAAATTAAPAAPTGAAAAASLGQAQPSYNNTDIPLPPDRDQMVAQARAASAGDPQLFQAMVSAGDARIAAAGESIRQHSQAAVAAVQPYLQDPKVRSVASIPPQVWNALPETTQTELMKHFAEGGDFPKTPDPVALAYLHNEMVTNPQGFADEDLTKWAGKLDKGSYSKMLSDQDEARKGSAKFRVKQDTVAQIMGSSQQMLVAAGLDPTNKANAPKIAQLQTRMTAWADQFENANRRPPNPKEIRDQMDGLLLQGSETQMAPGQGLFGSKGKYVFEHVPGRPFSYYIPDKVRSDLTQQYVQKYGHQPSDVVLGQLWRAGHAAGLFGGN